MTVAGRRAGIVAILAGGVVLALNMGLRQTYGLFLEPMTTALPVSHGAFGLAIAVQNLLWGALTPFFAAAADRWGTARILTAGALLYSAGLLGMATAQTPIGVHLGAGVLTGIAVAATGFPLVLAAVARSVPEARRSTALGLATAGGSVGQFVLLPGTQGLILGFGWSAALFTLAFLAALILPFAIPLRGRPARAEGREQRLGEALGEAGRHRGYLLLTSGFFVCGFHIAFVATHLPAYVTANGLAPLIGATALGIVGFFNIIGTFGFGWAGGRWRKKHVLCGIYLARAAAIAMLLVVPFTTVSVFAFAAVFGVLWLGTVPLTSGLVGDIFGARYLATLFGIVMFSHQIGAFFGAWLGGVSFDLTGGYEAVWLLAIGLSLLAAALHAPIADQPIERVAGVVR
jgi:predicted MFS family arabinose efflux permease